MKPFRARIKHDDYPNPARCIVIDVTGTRVNGDPEFIVIVDDGTIKTALPRDLIVEWPVLEAPLP